MLISIVVPVYNMEKYLARCVDSLLNQTYTDLEIILVNDGSTDSSGTMCDAYAEKDLRVKVVHQKNAGASVARNLGIEIAKGEYISMVDSDDWIEYNAYETLVKAIQNSNLMPDVVRFNAYIDRQIINPIPYKGLYVGERLKQDFVLSFIGPINFGGLFIMGVPWLQIYKKEFVDRHNIRYVLYNRLEDRLFNSNVYLNAHSVLFIDDVLYHYTVNRESLTNSYNSDQWQKELGFIEKLDAECKSSILYSDDLRRRFCNDVLLRAVMNIHYEFFSGIDNSFSIKYRNVKQIINDRYVKEASRIKQSGNITLKNQLILFLIKHRCTFLLCVFEEFIVFINKIKKNNG